jgi:RNase P subunit RPR2
VASPDDDVLSLICPSCSTPFASSIQMDRATFEKIRIDSVLERCPNCHHAARFQKADYSFRPEGH